MAVATLRWSSEKHNFLGISDQILANLGNENVAGKVLRLELDGGVFHFTPVVVQQDHGQPEVFLNRNLAQQLQIADGSCAIVSLESETILSAKRIWTEPLHPSDWDILETNAIQIQSEMLNQARIIQPHAPLVIHCHNIPLALKVTKTEPNNLKIAKISSGTEVLVSPKEWQRSTASLPKSLKSQKQEEQEPANGLWSRYSKPNHPGFSKTNLINKESIRKSSLRIVPFDVDGEH